MFCHLERSWLPHLDQAHPDVLRTLASRILAPLQLGDAQVRPLSVDRLGLRLRIEVRNHAHDVRLAFHQQATTPAQLAIELQRLVSADHVPLNRSERPGRILRSRYPWDSHLGDDFPQRA